MFQLALSMETDTQVTHWWMDIIRFLLATFDKVVYNLLVIVYQIFFNIADAQIFSSDVIIDFYGRVQMIIGVFMIFKVSVSLMQTVMNPDRFNDKEVGMGKMISRIIVMLALFTAIIPLNIPNATEGSYNAYLNENGLLFGVLYSLQSRVLSNNVLGKLVLGDVSSNDSVSETGQQAFDSDNSGNAQQLATFILKTFVRINLKSNATEDGATDPANYMCNLKDEESYKVERYKSDYVTVNTILSNDNLNDWCNGPNGKDDNYLFVYTPIISFICGLFVLVVMLGFCVDIAVRALKLAVLRLLAPIPIISYIDPKSSKDGSFASWVKALTSTYLDLFIRLIIIFFVLFLVQEIINKRGLVLPIDKGIVGAISTIFIIIGLFYFARTAPKFIKDSLGLKGNLSNFGLSAALAGLGALREKGTLGDAFDSIRENANTQIAAYNQGKQAPGLGDSYTGGRNDMAQIMTGDKNMTASRMHRAERYLKNHDLGPQHLDELEEAAQDARRAADYAKDIKDKINNSGYDSLTDREKQALEDWYRMQHGIKEGVDFTLAQIEDMKQSGFDYAQSTEEIASKAESKFKAAEEEVARVGGKRGSYRAKHGDLRDPHGASRNTQFRDLLTHEGREAIRTGNARETLRNVAAIPGNRGVHRAEQRRKELDKIVDADKAMAEQTNDHLRDARKKDDED